ncbi:hypothetical protein ACFYWX_17180 [Streptomyces sp. NPDC002888]|uniref:hypothetical protein n=1 Tax=Streptomyces sp. NPDC002888 TaxID=3364668 RepID=UPI0036C01398
MSISGLFLFVALSEMYDHFYRVFHLSAAAMGVEYSDTLLRSWGFIVVVVAPSGGIIYLLYGFMFKPVPFVMPDEGRGGDPSGNERERRTFFGLSTFIVSFVILTVSFLIVSPVVDERAQEAVKGYRVEPVRFADMVVLDLHATPVKRVSPIAEASQAPVPRGRLIYLGNDDRSYVLYNVDTKDVIRLSAERFILST